MKVSINDNGWVVVDGVGRQVDTSDLVEDVEAVYFDTVLNKGRIQYKDTAMIPVQERDFVAEKAAEDYARDHNLEAPTESLYKTVQIPKPSLDITDVGLIQVFIDRWVAAEPPPPEPPPAPDPRVVAIEADFQAGTVGSIQPATITQLKAMTVAEYNAWFTANFTNAAQALVLLRRITLLIIRRLL